MFVAFSMKSCCKSRNFLNKKQMLFTFTIIFVTYLKIKKGGVSLLKKNVSRCNMIKNSEEIVLMLQKCCTFAPEIAVED